MKYIWLILSFILYPLSFPAFGAVAHDYSDTYGNRGSHAPSLNYLHTVSGSNTLLLCTVAFNREGTTSIGSMTFNGASMTPLASRNYAGGADPTIAMYYLVNPDLGEHTAEVIFSGTTAFMAAFDCSSFTGVDQTTPLGTATITDNYVTGLSCTVPTNGLCYDAAYSISGAVGCAGGAGFAPGGSAVERFETCEDNGPGYYTDLFASTIAASATMTWNFDSGAFIGQIAVPINGAAAPSGAARRRIVGIQ